jgi:hypothetical protein
MISNRKPFLLHFSTQFWSIILNIRNATYQSGLITWRTWPSPSGDALQVGGIKTAQCVSTLSVSAHRQTLPHLNMYKLVSTKSKRTVSLSGLSKYHFKVQDICNHPLPWEVNWAFDPECKSEIHKFPTNVEPPRNRSIHPLRHTPSWRSA